MQAVLWTAAKVRQTFLEFFRSKGHEIVPSSPLVLPSDPTLLFVNAGMNQFKEIFLGARTPTSRRVANSQKCLRVSGKHNDLEEVGLDTYHHTFFEMLGNWSFGDYYKRESIGWGWELLTRVWGLPKERLWATIYRDDDEAEQAWREVTDIDPRHILRFGEADNFWEMGETGPCGPCSEVHFDRTSGGCTAAQINAGTPEVIEIWNHVFIQYNRRGDGSLEELPAKHVDTGMGLERITAVLQGRESNYDTDLFQPLIRRVAAMAGRPYTGADAVAMRVVADHLRALAFAIADGVLPSNDGRGYVLRRLLRRAVRYSRKLGITRPFLADLLPELEATMAAAYPELTRHREEIARAVRAEEESFAQTLDRGLELFDEVAAAVAARGSSVFPGAEAFKLYDTYGFPLDLTVLMAHERGLTVEQVEFERLMEEQRRRAREARRAVEGEVHGDVVADLVAAGIRTTFTGYATLRGSSTVLALLKGRGPAAMRVEALEEDAEGAVVLAESPFYPEKGGQIGDQGVLRGPAGEWEVLDTQQPAEGIVLHLGRMRRGRLAVGERVEAEVDAPRRAAIARHHTATHLLQNALRELVSGSIRQAGSLVTPERLRFDFSYFQALTPEQLAAVERRVNERILANDPVMVREMPFRDVARSDIIAIFDEKYGEIVRVVEVDGYSRELCGGTHVRATGELGLFRIMGESSIAAGVRRIEAAAGLAAYEATCRDHKLVSELARRFSASAEEVPGRVEALEEQVRSLQKALGEHETAAALGQVDALLGQAVTVAGVRLVAADVGAQSPEALKSLADALGKRLGSGVVVLGGVSDGKAQFLAAVSPDLVKRGLHAGQLVKEVAKIASGGGGGQPGFARAGGKDPNRVGEAVRQAVQLLAAMLKGQARQ